MLFSKRVFDYNFISNIYTENLEGIFLAFKSYLNLDYRCFIGHYNC